MRRAGSISTSGVSVVSAVFFVSMLSACGSSNDNGEERETDSGKSRGTDTVSDGQPDAGGDTDSETADENDSATTPEQDTFPEIYYDTEMETDPAELNLAGPCPLDERIGGLKVEMNMAMGYTSVDGVVYDCQEPSQVPDIEAEEGNCRLLRKRRLLCDPPCGSDTTCSLNETCVPAPREQDVGIAVIHGLSESLAIAPVEPGFTYFYTRLDHPGFEEGDIIRLRTTDGYMGEMSLYGIGVEPLAAANDTWLIEEGEDLMLEWPTPPDGARSIMSISINIDQHGLTPITLVCDLEDTGSAAIPKSLVNALIASGVTGFPSGKAIRRTVDSLENDNGCVEFEVTSVRIASIEVSGHIPCTRDEHCPIGQSCDTTIEQCH